MKRGDTRRHAGLYVFGPEFLGVGRIFCRQKSFFFVSMAPRTVEPTRPQPKE